MSDAVRMFIGSSSNGEDGLIEMAYEYTLKQNTLRDVNINWMRQTRDESSFWHGFEDKNWSTPFSGFRWAIPEACNFEGKAIYTDCDMLNFHDIGELFDMEIPEDKWMLARNGTRFGGKEFCVILFDCAKFKDKIISKDEWKKIPNAHQQLMQAFIANDVVGELDPSWNSHDGDVVPYKQLHYTNMPTQPWKPKWFTGESIEHPKEELIDVFWKKVEEAELTGYYPEDYDPTDDPSYVPVEYGIIGQ